MASNSPFVYVDHRICASHADAMKVADDISISFYFGNNHVTLDFNKAVIVTTHFISDIVSRLSLKHLDAISIVGNNRAQRLFNETVEMKRNKDNKNVG